MSHTGVHHTSTPLLVKYCNGQPCSLVVIFHILPCFGLPYVPIILNVCFWLHYATGSGAHVWVQLLLPPGTPCSNGLVVTPSIISGNAITSYVMPEVSITGSTPCGTASLFMLVSVCPYCSPTRAPGNPPPVLACPLPIAPFCGRGFEMPILHLLPASLAMDLCGSMIPAPPHSWILSGTEVLRLGGGGGGRRFHLAGGCQFGACQTKPTV
jgi:hypothetical protein